MGLDLDWHWFRTRAWLRARFSREPPAWWESYTPDELAAASLLMFEEKTAERVLWSEDASEREESLEALRRCVEFRRRHGFADGLPSTAAIGSE